MQTPTEQPAASTRRDFLRGVGGAMAVTAVVPHLTLTPAPDLALPIAVSDRGVGLRQQMGVFALARQCGVLSVELDLGRLGAAAMMGNRLLDATMRARFVDAAETAGVTISSLALTAFVDQPFSTHPKADEYADDLLYLMREMRVPVGYLPLDAYDDHSCGQTAERLKRLAPAAERGGLKIAVGSSLPAEKLAGLLDAVGSPAIRATIVAAPGRDAAVDLAAIGPARVAQVRYRHDNETDPSAALAMLAVALRAAGWAGRFVIERPAVTAGDDAANLSLAADRLRGLFSPALT